MNPSFVKNSQLDRDGIAQALRDWLSAVLPATRLNLRGEVRIEPVAGKSAGSAEGFENPEIVVVLSGADQGLLLERNAELLLALEYLAVRSLRLDPPFFDRIRFDSGDYRATRIAELTMSARVAADRVRETRQPFRFNPMAARERRIVHMALRDIKGVRTESMGQEPQRRVQIIPEKLAP